MVVQLLHAALAVKGKAYLRIATIHLGMLSVLSNPSSGGKLLKTVGHKALREMKN